MIENNNYIIDNQYFSCINWYKISNQSSNIKLLSSEKWLKSSFFNRCIVAGANGLVQLSVPLLGGRNQNCIYKDVRIDYSNNWQIVHWRTINSCYRRAPYFEFYEEKIRDVLEKRYEFLFDLNIEILLTINSFINKNQYVEKYDGFFSKEEKIPLSYCNPKTYNQIPNPVRYPQLFEDRIGFLPNLSILDLLFMEGPNAANLLK